MAKFSENEIPSLEEDWGRDPINGLPYSGGAVQKLIKDEIKNRPTEEGTKDIIDEKVFDKASTKRIVTNLESAGNTLRVTAINAEGIEETFNVDNADANDRIVVLSSELSNPYINVGGTSILRYGVNVTDYQGEVMPSTDGTAVVGITMTKQGKPHPFYSNSLGAVPLTQLAGTYNSQIDLTSILKSNITSSETVTIVLSVDYTYSFNKDGQVLTKTVTKYSTVTLTILDLILTTGFTLGKANVTQLGINIPFTVKGNGNKSVSLYANGTLIDQQDNITNDIYSGSFTDSQVGSRGHRVNYQLVAKATAGDAVVTSSSFYVDVYTSEMRPVICVMVEDKTGAIQADTANPAFNASRFSDFSMKYFVLHPSPLTEGVNLTIESSEVDSNNDKISTTTLEQSVDREVYTFSKRIKSSHQIQIILRTNQTERLVKVNPTTSIVNIELPTESQLLNLDADGRSNQESNPATWKFGEYSTQFSRFNWASNGWKDDEGSTALFLQNGAKAVINFPLFATIGGKQVIKDGCAFELIFKCDKGSIEENDIITCSWKGNNGNYIGLKVTTAYVGVNTGNVTNFTGDNGNVTTVEDKVGSFYDQGSYYKYTFVIDPNAGKNGLCMAYINGILSFVSEIPREFVNADRIPITIDSTYADVYIKSIRYYNEPLTHDQCVDSFIIDLTSSLDIESLYSSNNILSVDDKGNTYVSPQKLRQLGRGVMIITGYDTEHDMSVLEYLNRSTDKKSYFGPVRVDYFAPVNDLDLGYKDSNGSPIVPAKGNSYNFTHKQCAIRVQGTTSTKRPRKNYRLHFNIARVEGKNKIKPSDTDFIVGGEYNTSFKYAMSPSAVPVPIACLKVDYVDSSMTHNTGGATVFNELTRNVESLRNPAQIREFKGSATDIKTRVAIEGFPIDVFSANSVVNGDYTDSLDDSNYKGLVYMGQYNFNNDKSKSGKVFGFDGAYTYDENGEYSESGAYQPICMEFLDNNVDLCLFKIKFKDNGDIDEDATYGIKTIAKDDGKTEQLDNFGIALEVRAPEDITDQIADNGLNSVKPSDNFGYVPTQIKRVFNFIGECAKEVAQNNSDKLSGVTALNTASSDLLESLDWTSNKFITEVQDYFNLASVCAWYIWTDYLIAVDQRAKNMMMYTMDGKHWMFQYYDGDTMLGERNDCFLAYDYMTDRDTYDSAVGQYAMQGHDSWLWYLIRANFSSQRTLTEGGSSVQDPLTATNLSSVCSAMRSSTKFSPEYFKRIFNTQFVDSWSQRQYNYSQDYKYIQPLIETGYPSAIGTNFINTAQGSREAHRNFIIDNRFSLLDSKYMVGDYSQSDFSYYADANSENKLTIVASAPYYFGWKISGTGIREHQAATEANDYTVHLNITGNSANNPASVFGANRVRELLFSTTSSWVVDSSKTVNLPALHKLVAKGMKAKARGDMYLNCPLLEHLDVSDTQFSALQGLESCSKLTYIDVTDTTINSLIFADGSPLTTAKLAAPQILHLSNLTNLIYNEGSGDTLTALSWNSLSSLIVDACPKIDKYKLIQKLLDSSATRKSLKVTGIDVTATLSWLDKFNGVTSLSGEGNAELSGVLKLIDYEDATRVSQAQAKYPNLQILQPFATVIELDETVTDEEGYTTPTSTNPYNVSNLSNSTGYRFGSQYKPSGYINQILNATHRVLGKLIAPASIIKGNPYGTEEMFVPLNLRNSTQGRMMVINLADQDSRYYASGYNNGVGLAAPLDGLMGHGEVYSNIPKFIYKGINYNTPDGGGIEGKETSLRYTAFHYPYIESGAGATQIPISNEVASLRISDLKNVDASGSTTANGLFKANTYVRKTGNKDSIALRLDNASSTSYDVIRVTVSGYKKVMYPKAIGTTLCSVFTDASNNVIAINNSVETANGVGSGEVCCSSNKYGYNGMPVIATIPAGAVYFYITVPKYITGTVDADPCNIVLHRGKSFANGDAMNETNALQWIPDMEPNWVVSSEMLVAAAECAVHNVNLTYGDNAQVLELYSPFDVHDLTNPASHYAVRGTNYQENELDYPLEWYQHRFSQYATKRGLMLVDYEATKIIALLFVARYGRRNSQHVLGGGAHTVARPLGATAKIGMRDTIVIDTAPSLDSESRLPYAWSPLDQSDIGSNNFLGIENVSGNVFEWMDKAFLINETASVRGKVRILMPNFTLRSVYGIGNWFISATHGRYCDIISCSPNAGSSIIGYSDYQSFPANAYTQWKQVRAFRRSNGYADAVGGVFYFYGSYSVAFSNSNYGSRLMFRGNIEHTSSISAFQNATEYREVNMPEALRV